MDISKKAPRRAAPKPSKALLSAGLRDAMSSPQTESELLINILETLSQSQHMSEYLEQLTEHLRNYSGCCCVGIRLLDNDGNIPYVSYTGFSQKFYESESPLCIKSDKCMCINVIKGDTEPNLAFYTDGGSFLSNGTTNLLTSVPQEIIGENRSVCNQWGYESVALIPMRHKGRVLGLIHLADESEQKIPTEMVRFLERVGGYIGEAMHTFMAEEERRRAEEALRQSEANYRTLIESSPDGVLSLDSKGHIIDCNEGIIRLLGYTREEINGKDASQLLAGAMPDELSAFYARLTKSGLLEQEFEVASSDGRIIPVWAKIVALYDTNGDFTRAVIYMRDITERKKVDQLKDEFIGLVSHEIRSPLTVIVGAVNTVLSEAERLSPEETRQLLQDAALEAESLTHLLGNLLELSKAQADRLLLYPEPISVSNVIQQTIEKMERQSPGHRFVVDVPEDLPHLHADQLRLERIVYNLLENASKYSPQGSEIRVFAKLEETHLLIGVSDQGPGISPDDQAKLFQPFERLDDSRLYGPTGTGLGLVVCERLVEAHGGRIWVESSPGQGYTFFFTLPLS